MTPILLIHGFPLDSSMWQAQAEHLRKKGRTVLTPDLPGFGDAPPLASDDPTIGDYAQHIHEIIQREAGGHAIIGGFSMGGYILLALLRHHPEAVAAAMFLDTRADADSPDARAARLKSIEQVKADGPNAIIEGLLTKQLAKKPTAANREKARAIMQRQPAAAIIAAQTAMSKRRDQTDLLAQLSIPVLVLVGAEDAITPPSVALAMQSHMPHAMAVQIVGAGHLSPVEQPAAVSGAIETFLATVHEPNPLPV